MRGLHAEQDEAMGLAKSAISIAGKYELRNGEVRPKGWDGNLSSKARRTKA